MDIKSQDQGLTPATPGIDPVVPPAPAADSAVSPMTVSVEPVPLPKVTDVAEVPAETPPLAEIPPAGTIPLSQTPHPLFEKPETVAPGVKDDGRWTMDDGRKKKDEGHGLPKRVVAGVAALVFLVVGLGSGLYLVKQRGIGEIRKSAGNVPVGSDSGCCNNDPQCVSWYGTGSRCANSNGACQTGWQCVGGSPSETGCRETCSSNDCGRVICAGTTAQQTCNGGCGGGGGGNTNPCEGVSCPGGQHCDGGQCVDNVRPTDTPYQWESISFVCDRCNEFQQCNFGPVRDGGGSGSSSPCGQVDKCEVGPSGDIRYNTCRARKLCDASCSGVRPTSPPGPQATATPAPPGEQPSATPTPVTISANCQSLTGQVSDDAGGWVTKTDSEFAATARPGDRVRFVCTGAKSRGSFTKSAFFINSVLHVDDVVKLNDTQFAVEYTIPAAGTLTVESVLLHDSKGWVD